jgi:hypothetical protein
MSRTTARPVPLDREEFDIEIARLTAVLKKGGQRPT